jgi:hypothetical protein
LKTIKLDHFGGPASEKRQLLLLLLLLQQYGHALQAVLEQETLQACNLMEGILAEQSLNILTCSGMMWDRWLTYF